MNFLLPFYRLVVASLLIPASLVLTTSLGFAADNVATKTKASEKRKAKNFRCLALNVYFEARGETAEGQLAVALVTMNRVKNRRYPNSTCRVVWQKRQFSWTHDGKSDRPTDKRAWRLAKKIATLVYYKYETMPARIRKALDLTKGALHFYAPQLANPYWASSQEVTRTIGGHIFLRDRRT